MSDRMAEAIERLADVLETQETRLAAMEEERGPTFMEFLASGVRSNDANTIVAEAATETHKLSHEAQKLRLKADEQWAKRMEKLDEKA